MEKAVYYTAIKCYVYFQIPDTFQLLITLLEIGFLLQE